MYWFLRWLIYPRDYKNETTFIVYLFKGLPLFEQNEKYQSEIESLKAQNAEMKAQISEIETLKAQVAEILRKEERQ